MITVALLGTGALGGLLQARLDTKEIRGCLPGPVLTRSDEADEALLEGADVLVEAAGAEAARRWVPVALAAGLDVILCSCGTLADPDFVAQLGAAGSGRLLIPSRAIGGLDLFRAAIRGSAGTAEVTLTTTHRPEALTRLPEALPERPEAEAPDTDRTEIFNGTARQAARAFPKTSNVAVALGLATVGLDRTRVRILADPAAGRTRHVVHVRSDLGEYHLEAENAIAAGSGGRSSAVTVWSVVTVLEDLASGCTGGLPVDLGPATAVISP